MKKTRKNTLIALSLTATATLALGIFAGCSSANGPELKPSGTTYDYNFDEPFAADDKVDSFMTIDGNLDEAEWQNVNYLTHAQSGVSFKIGTIFTDNGLYLGAASTDSKIVWSGAFEFEDNTGFQFHIVSTEAVNDPNNIESTAHHPTERMTFNIDSKNIRSYNGVPVYARSVSTETSLSCEMFFTWEDLHFSARPERVRIASCYKKVVSAGSNDNTWIYPAGYNPSDTYTSMYLFDTNGSISQSGSRKNTADMQLGNSKFGFGASDSWDLSKDNSTEATRSATTTTNKNEVIWLKEKSAKNFEFSTTLKFNSEDTARADRRRAGIIVANSSMQRRLFVSNHTGKTFSLGDTVANMFWINPTEVLNAAGDANSLSLKVIKQGETLYYLYKYSSDAQYKLAYTEDYDKYANSECVVGLYTSCQTTFSDWNFISYDSNLASLTAQLGNYVYFIESQVQGAGTMSVPSVVGKGNSLSVSVIPRANSRLTGFTVDGADKLSDFKANANEGVYTFTPTANTSLSAKFEVFSAQDRESLISSQMTVKDANGTAITGATVSVYPVNANGEKNDYSSIYFYQTETTNKGIAVFSLPYKNSALYAAGAYLVKIATTAAFNYEKIITVEKPATGSVAQIQITVPSTLSISGSSDVKWSVNGDGSAITVEASTVGDHKSLAYYNKTLVNGEISATFTTSSQTNAMIGFGYRQQKGNYDVGLIGIIYNSNGLSATTYCYAPSGYMANTYTIRAGTKAEIETYLGSENFKVNGDGSVTFKLKMIKDTDGIWLFIGDKLARMFEYGKDVPIEASELVQLGIMSRTIGTISKGNTYTVTNFAEPASWTPADRRATVSGLLTNGSNSNMTVKISGTNAYGIDVTRQFTVQVSDGKYSFTVDGLDETEREFKVEFYQDGQSWKDLSPENSEVNPIIFRLKAKQFTSYDITFNQGKATYTMTLRLSDTATPIVLTAEANEHDKVSLPTSYDYNSCLYVLNESAGDSLISGSVKADGSLALKGSYVKSFAYENKTFSLQHGADANGLTISFPQTAAEKWIISKDKSNGFTITATITGGEFISELASGFVLSDGTNFVTFMWNNWSGGGLTARGSVHQPVGHTDFGSMSKYNAVSNNSARIKLVYVGGIATFYLVGTSSETKIGEFNLLTQTQVNTAGWTADSKLHVGLFSWNNTASAATFSNIQLAMQDLVSYNTNVYLPDGNGGYTLTTNTLSAPEGEVVSISNGYNNTANKTLYVVDSTKSNTLSGTVTVGTTLELTAYYMSFMEYSKLQSMQVDVNASGTPIIKTDGSANNKYVLSKEAATSFTVKAKITNTSDSDSGLGFAIAQGSNTALFYFGSWDNASMWAKANASNAWFIQKGNATNGIQLQKNVAKEFKMDYANGVFTISALSGGVETGWTVTYTVDEFINKGINFNAAEPFYYGVGGYHDTLSQGYFSDITMEKTSTYKTNLYLPDGNGGYTLTTKTLNATVGQSVTIANSYDDTTNQVLYAIDSSKTNVLFGTVAEGTTLELTAYYKTVMEYSKLQSMQVDVNNLGTPIVKTDGSANNKYVLSKNAGTSFTITAQVTNTSDSACGMGFVVGQGDNTTMFYFPSWDAGKLMCISNATWATYLEKSVGTGHEVLTKNNTLSIKLEYADGTFTLSGMKNSVMTALATFTVDELITKGVQYDPTEGFYVGVGCYHDAISQGYFSDISMEINEAKIVSYTQNVYAPDGAGGYGAVQTTNLNNKENKVVYVDAAADVDGSVYVADGTYAGDKLSDTLVDGTATTLTAHLNKKVFEYDFSTNNWKFGSSKDKNLVLETTDFSRRYIYSSQSSTQFTIVATFTSVTQNCETGFSVMNEHGDKLSFKLVSWNSSLSIRMNNSVANYAYLDVGVGKFNNGDTATLKLVYNAGTFTFYRYNGTDFVQAGTWTQSQTTSTFGATADFSGAMKAGFFTWGDGTSGASIELKELTFTNPGATTKRTVDNLFIGDSWIDKEFWTNFNTDFATSSFNYGYGGTKVAYWRNQVANLKRAFNPTNVVIHIGINDVNARTSAATVAENVQALMDKLRVAFPSANIYWISISPTNYVANGFPTPAESWAVAKEVNASMQTFINGKANYHYINFASALCTAVGQNYDTTTAGSAFASYYKADGLHLNTTPGYPLFVQTIKDALAGN